MERSHLEGWNHHLCHKDLMYMFAKEVKDWFNGLAFSTSKRNKNKWSVFLLFIFNGYVRYLGQLVLFFFLLLTQKIPFELLYKQQLLILLDNLGSSLNSGTFLVQYSCRRKDKQVYKHYKTKQIKQNSATRIPPKKIDFRCSSQLKPNILYMTDSARQNILKYWHTITFNFII